MHEEKNDHDGVGQLLSYMRLVVTRGVGPQILSRLLDRFSTPEDVFAASPKELAEVEGVSVGIARQIRSGEWRDEASRIRTYCEQEAIEILPPWDSRFPRVLREIPDPPALLYCRGSFQPQFGIALAIVGTRGASNYGRTQAARFARCLSRAGVTIVSGLARGIDAAAHEGALDADGSTIAVLSNGVSEIYPPQHTELARRIAKTGVVLSEMPPGTKPKKGMFPQRNRLISGLSLGTLVIEAGSRSGALITARLAGEQGRDVFALPGLVTSPNAHGCHQLIRDGALLVESPEDILEALGPMVEHVEVAPDHVVHHPAELQLNTQENAVLQAIEPEPTDINTIVVASGLPVPRVLSTLSVLEMRRLVRRVGGQCVQRV